MVEEQILKSHRQEMERQKFPVFQLFDALEQAGLPPDALDALRREAAPIAEAVIEEELTTSPALLRTVQAIVRTGMPEALTTLTAWRKAVAGAAPRRDAMQLMIDGFGGWLEQLNPEVRAPFLEALPQLGPCAHELRREGLEEILLSVNACGSSERATTLLAAISTYGMTLGPIALGVCRIAVHAQTWKAEELLSRLLAALPVDRVLESAEGEKLLPAMGTLSAWCAGQGEAWWRPAMNLTVTLAEKDCSSAYVAARDLGKLLPKQAPDLARAWLEGFDRLARAMGLRVVSFGLKELPKLYAAFGVARTTRFVEAAAEVAEAYGATAGQWFLERKTTAAKGMLGR